jgi:hypothetical protein
VSIFLPVLCLTKRIVRDRPVLKQKPQGLTAWIMQYVAAHMSEDSRIGPLLYADIMYTYLVLDSFTAFLINPFTAGCNGTTELYLTL